MVTGAATSSGSSDLHKAVGRMFRELSRSAKDGTVPFEVFERAVTELRLDRSARDRVIKTLAQLGLRVVPQPSLQPVPPSVPAQGSSNTLEEVHDIMSGRLEKTIALLRRLAGDGALTSVQLQRAATMAGLTAQERELLPGLAVRAGIRITQEELVEQASRTPVTAVTTLAPRKVPSDSERKEPSSNLGAAIEAARRVLQADKSRKRLDLHLLSAEEEVGLCVLLRGGPDLLDTEPADDAFAKLPPDDIRRHARDAFILHNTRLVHSIAQAYVGQGVEYEDLVQHGVEGLMHAVCKFDIRKGNKFSTYATWWIKQAITRAVTNEGSIIRIPVHFYEDMQRVAKAEARLRTEGRPATTAEVALACDMTITAVDNIRCVSRVTDSLDRVIIEGSTLGDLLSHTRPSPSPEEVLHPRFSRQVVEQMLMHLPDREADVLRRRIGLIDGEPQILEKIGTSYGVTRERIRQLERKALKHLRELFFPSATDETSDKKSPDE